MSDNKNVTPEGNTVEVVEKKGFFAKAKDKKQAWVDKHPVASRRIGTVVKVTVGAAAGLVTGMILGSKSKADDSGVEMIDLDQVSFEDVTDDAAGNDN